MCFSNNKRELPWTWSSTTTNTWSSLKKREPPSKERSTSLTTTRGTCPLQVPKSPRHPSARRELPSLLDPSTRRCTLRNYSRSANRPAFLVSSWRSCCIALALRGIVEFKDVPWVSLPASRNPMMSSQMHPKARAISTNASIGISRTVTRWRALRLTTSTMPSRTPTRARPTASMTFWRRHKMWALRSPRHHIRQHSAWHLARRARREELVVVMALPMSIVESVVSIRADRSWLQPTHVQGRRNSENSQRTYRPSASIPKQWIRDLNQSIISWLWVQKTSRRRTS